jgi:hypothetical protein
MELHDQAAELPISNILPLVLFTTVKFVMPAFIDIEQAGTDFQCPTTGMMRDIYTNTSSVIYPPVISKII